jgi:hypothetical protein
MSLYFKINNEPISFLHQHDFLLKDKYDVNEIVELQYELDEALEFCKHNLRINKEDNTLEYESYFFSIVETHILNSINIVGGDF